MHFGIRFVAHEAPALLHTMPIARFVPLGHGQAQELHIRCRKRHSTAPIHQGPFVATHNEGAALMCHSY
jgi:hypothetical protein